MWRELELLKCENAVLQRELAEHKNGGSTIASRTTTTPLIRLKEVSDLFADFTGEKNNFDAWKGQSEMLRTMYRLKTRWKLLSRHMKGKARVISTPTHFQLSVELFKNMDLKKMFNPRRSKLEWRRNFEKNRAWQTGESFTAYFHAKTILTKLRLPRTNWLII